MRAQVVEDVAGVLGYGAEGEDGEQGFAAGEETIEGGTAGEAEMVFKGYAPRYGPSRLRVRYRHSLHILPRVMFGWSRSFDLVVGWKS